MIYSTFIGQMTFRIYLNSTTECEFNESDLFCKKHSNESNREKSRKKKTEKNLPTQLRFCFN